MIGDPTLGAQLRPHGLGKAEVRRVVTVQVAQRTPADGEREFAASTRAGRDTRPRPDLGGDALTGGDPVGGNGMDDLLGSKSG